MARVISVCSLKGGVGKTTVSYSLCAAAAAHGKCVIALDLDPTGGLSIAFHTGERRANIGDVLAGRTGLRDALVRHPSGVFYVAGSALLNEMRLGGALLQRTLAPLRGDPHVDLIVIDTQPHEAALGGPMMVADRVVLPTKLDRLSLRAAAMTVGIAEHHQVIDRCVGIAVTDAKRPLSNLAQGYLSSLQKSGLSLDTVLYYNHAWQEMVTGRRSSPDPRVLEQASRLLREVMLRQPPVTRMRAFIAHAQGQVRPSGGASSTSAA